MSKPYILKKIKLPIFMNIHKSQWVKFICDDLVKQCSFSLQNS